MAGAIVGWPVCAVCRKPVDRVTRANDSFRGVVKFVVQCHGASEVEELDELQAMMADSVEFAEAFRTARISCDET